MSALHLRGNVLPEGSRHDVYVVRGRVTFYPPPDATTVVDGGWITPGLVDCHAHLALHSPLGNDGPPAEQVRASARAHLDAGVLLVREPGSPNYASRDLDASEGLPRVLTAGRFLAPPGRYFPGLALEVAPDRLPDAVAEEARHGTGWVKVIVDFAGPRQRIQPNWDAKTLRAAAQAAHATGARIAGHAACPAAIEAAVRAGIDSIEHGTGLTLDLVDALVEHGTALVPTMLINDRFVSGMAQLAGNEAAEDVAAWAATQPRAVAAAAAAGVTVLAGTDAGMVPHGLITHEIDRLLAAGIPPQRAVGAASWDARHYLGLPGVVEGAPADLAVFDADPRSEPETLTRPVLRMVEGRLIS